MNITFSVNIHDKDGDKYDEGIFLHFDDRFILKVNDLDNLEDIIEQLKSIKTEINQNYKDEIS